jgi:hypothetical protein
MTGGQGHATLIGMSHRGTSSQNNTTPEQLGTFTVIGLLEGVAVAAFVVINRLRRVSGGLLIVAGIALVTIWMFTGDRYVVT